MNRYRVFVLLMIGLVSLTCARPAEAVQRLVPGKNALEGIVIHHARIDKQGILFDVGTFFESFVPIRGATADVQRRLDEMCRRHAEGDCLPASIVLSVFVGDYDRDARVLTVEAIQPARSFRLSDEQVDLLLQFFRGRAMHAGTEEDRAALDRLIRSGQMKEYVHEVVRLVNQVRR